MQSRFLRQCSRIWAAGLAKRIIELLLEAERELQETPTHSRAGSDADQLESTSWGSGGGAEAVGARELLRQAVDALAAGEERRAVRCLQQAQAACPEQDIAERRRIALYLELIQCKKQA